MMMKTGKLEELSESPPNPGPDVDDWATAPASWWEAAPGVGTKTSRFIGPDSANYKAPPKAHPSGYGQRGQAHRVFRQMQALYYWNRCNERFTAQGEADLLPPAYLRLGGAQAFALWTQRSLHTKDDRTQAFGTDLWDDIPGITGGKAVAVPGMYNAALQTYWEA